MINLKFNVKNSNYIESKEPINDLEPENTNSVIYRMHNDKKETKIKTLSERGSIFFPNLDST